MSNDSDDVLMTARQVRRRIGGISKMTLWRWRAHEKLKFPPPDRTINGRNYWRAGIIEAWERSHRPTHEAA